MYIEYSINIIYYTSKYVHKRTDRSTNYLSIYLSNYLYIYSSTFLSIYLRYILLSRNIHILLNLFLFLSYVL